MKAFNKKPLNKKQYGLSLVELLIAMVLGLFLTAGALEMMLASRSLERTTDDVSRIQENGRFAIEFLAKDIRLAGHNVSQDAGFRQGFYDGDCTAAFSPCTADGGGNTSDRIGIKLDPTHDQDCTGTNVPEDEVVVNLYYIADEDNNGVPSLYCRGFNDFTSTWNSAAQPLVDGIENMQLLFGISDLTDGNRVSHYINAGDVTALEWEAIGAVRLSLLVNNGLAQGNSDEVTRNFVLLDAPQLTVTDKHAREVYRTTTSVYNTLYPK